MSKELQISPVFVVHERWFMDSTIVYREGMGDIYRVRDKMRVDSIHGNVERCAIAANQFS